MGAAARRLVRSRLAAFVVCAGGVLLSVPSAGLAAGWTANPETVTAQNGVTGVATGLDGSSNLIAVWADASGDRGERARSCERRPSAAQRRPERDRHRRRRARRRRRERRQGRRDLDRRERQHLGLRAPVRTRGAGPTKLSDTTDASSAQAAMVDGIASAFWIDGTVIERATASSAASGRPIAARPRSAHPAAPACSPTCASRSHPTEAASPPGSAPTETPSRSRPRLIAANGDWTLNGPIAGRTADDSSTVAVAAGAGVAAVAWSEPGSGVQVAVFERHELRRRVGRHDRRRRAAVARGRLDRPPLRDCARRRLALGRDPRHLRHVAWATPTALASRRGVRRARRPTASVTSSSRGRPRSDVQMRVFDTTKPVLDADHARRLP